MSVKDCRILNELEEFARHIPKFKNPIIFTAHGYRSEIDSNLYGVLAFVYYKGQHLEEFRVRYKVDDCNIDLNWELVVKLVDEAWYSDDILLRFKKVSTVSELKDLCEDLSHLLV